KLSRVLADADAALGILVGVCEDRPVATIGERREAHVAGPRALHGCGAAVAAGQRQPCPAPVRGCAPGAVVHRAPPGHAVFTATRLRDAPAALLRNDVAHGLATSASCSGVDLRVNPSASNSRAALASMSACVRGRLPAVVVSIFVMT